MSSHQPFDDGHLLPEAIGSLSVETSPTRSSSVPSSGDLSYGVIDLSSTTEPLQPSAAVPASVPVLFSPLVLFPSSLYKPSRGAVKNLFPFWGLCLQMRMNPWLGN